MSLKEGKKIITSTTGETVAGVWEKDTLVSEVTPFQNNRKQLWLKLKKMTFNKYFNRAYGLFNSFVITRTG